MRKCPKKTILYKVPNIRVSSITAKYFDTQLLLLGLKVEILFEKNPSLLDGKGFYGRTQLIWAAYENNFNVCDYLIRNKSVNVNAKDDTQSSALWYACRNNNYELAKLLIESGATNDKDYFGETPLEKALNGNNQKLKDLMQSHFGN